VEIVAEENRTMMMDPTTIYAYTREWWDMRRLKIIERRRKIRVDASLAVSGGAYGVADDLVAASAGVLGGATGDGLVA
jgi:hypothetical protein